MSLEIFKSQLFKNAILWFGVISKINKPSHTYTVHKGARERQGLFVTSWFAIFVALELYTNELLIGVYAVNGVFPKIYRENEFSILKCKIEFETSWQDPRPV